MCGGKTHGGKTHGGKTQWQQNAVAVRINNGKLCPAERLRNEFFLSILE
jgi:hypothetical protein